MKMNSSSTNRPVKYLIWLYLILLIFEGTLRKWVVPSLSNPLLIVRDPIVFSIYLFAFSSGKLKANGFLIGSVFLAFLAFVFSLAFGHGDLLVTVYGVRTNFFYIPLIFVMHNVLNRDDVILMGKFVLLLSIPMTFLLVLQFYSHPLAFINIGPGGSASAGLSGVGDRWRPSGTFSFITGIAIFYPFVTAFLMTFKIQKIKFNNILIIASAIALVITIPFSISRSLALACILVFIIVLLGLQLVKKSGVGMGKLIGLGVVVLLILPYISFFDEGVDVFSTRWDQSTGEGVSGFQGAIVIRTFAPIINSLEQAFDSPFFGQGVGLGTNVGASLTTGDTAFLLGEGEWSRIFGEMGPLLGFAYILFRIAIVLILMKLSYRCLIRRNDVLPLALFASCFLLILIGQWGPPTVLGFAIFGGGLVMASSNYVDESDKGKLVQKRRRPRSRPRPRIVNHPQPL